MTNSFMFVSDEDRQVALREGIAADASKAATIYNGVDLDAYPPKGSCLRDAAELRSKLQIPPASPVVGIVGRVVREKGYIEFAEMAKSVSAGRSDVSPQTLLAGVARRCRYVALHVPITENCGGCLEPLLTGVPTIAGNVGGLPELVIDGVTGRTVAVRQRDELVHAILDVVSNPAYYRTLAENGRQLVRTMFDVVRTSAEVHQVYEHILGRGPRPTPFNPQHTATALL